MEIVESKRKFDEQEKLALIKIYHATGGPKWKRNGRCVVHNIMLLICHIFGRGNTRWLSNPEPNTWSGIVIEDGNVTKIILSGNNLSGVLPDIFAALPKLKVLYLNGNDLKGEIPVYVK